ncbi:hypothetical protein [Flavisphingomonas formosensis]|uniref:hypothetical protein n=1 Tax=Flavisphingomonas formosensis TaxID=861534 RepID=UPI0012F9E780|nr:hypothetical protein [Sphingomonas formosensis]
MAKAATRPAAEAPLTSGALPIRIERHIKLHCYYDARCDTAVLVRRIEGRHPGALKEFLAKLTPALAESNVYRLRRKPSGWH